MMTHASQKKRRGGRARTDVVGVEIGANLSSGTPVVRVRRTPGGAMEVTAAGFLSVSSELPDAAADVADTDGSWLLPKAYSAPCAAFAVTAESVILRQATSVEDALSDQEKDGCRAGVHTPEGNGLALVAGLPDAVGAWVATLLPEGRKPTACSIQVSPLAWINAFVVSEAFAQTNGTALLVLVGRHSTAIVILHDRRVVLYREHSIGSEDVVQALCRDMNLDTVTVETILDDNLVDPSAALETVLAPLFRQVELSTDYAHRKNQCFVDRFFLAGLPKGGRYWAQVFKRKTGGELVFCNPLNGFPVSEGARVPEAFSEISHQFVAAAGAAIAVLEDE